MMPRGPGPPRVAGLVLVALLVCIMRAHGQLQGGAEEEPFHRCEHSERATRVQLVDAAQQYELQSEAPAGGRRLLQATTWKPLRLVADFRYLKSADAAFRSLIQTKVVPEAIKRFSAMLRTVPVSGNLKLQCARRFVATGACVPNQGPTMCGDLEIPQDHIDFGVPNADVILYVTATAETSRTLLAYAASCQRDQKGRPIAGIISFNTNSAGLQSASAAEQKLTYTALHEITHVLVFSESLYPFFRTSSGNTVGQVTRQFNERGKVVTKIVTPKVLQAARAHFGCTTLNGAELEDQGGTGTAGSHWEARVLLNELMAGELQHRPKFSAITLALFQDSGWYLPDYTAADPLYWGRNAGCPFALERCIAQGASGPVSVSAPHFCSTPSSTGCSLDGTAVSFCEFSSYNRIPASFQYFSDPVVGGSVQNADFCPVFLTSETSDCRTGAGSSNAAVFGETWACPECRCFPTSLLRSGLVSSSRRSHGCFQFRCLELPGGGYNLTVLLPPASSAAGAPSVACPPAGGPVSVPGYSGTLTCPNATDACAAGPSPGAGLTDCPGACSGHGICIDAVCRCDEGYEGEECGRRACPASCRAPSGACDGATGACVCAPGFTGADCSKDSSAVLVPGLPQLFPLQPAASTRFLRLPPPPGPAASPPLPASLLLRALRGRLRVLAAASAAAVRSGNATDPALLATFELDAAAGPREVLVPPGAGPAGFAPLYLAAAALPGTPEPPLLLVNATLACDGPACPATAACPLYCSGRGTCDPLWRQCDCEQGYKGLDCGDADPL
eukprot:tig00000989_g6116.t1